MNLGSLHFLAMNIVKFGSQKGANCLQIYHLPLASSDDDGNDEEEEKNEC